MKTNKSDELYNQYQRSSQSKQQEDSTILSYKNSQTIQNSSATKTLNQTKANEQQTFQKVLNLVLRPPFDEKIVISDLENGKMYKIEGFLRNNRETYRCIVHSRTKVKYCDIDQSERFDDGIYLENGLYKYKEILGGKKEIHGFCDSENVLFQGALRNPDMFMGSKKDIKKQILDARTAKSVTTFINQENKFSKPKENKRERLQRTLLVARGMETYDEMYGFRKEAKQQNGKEFLKNDWFMGPFYSYNENSNQMFQKQKQKNQSQGI